jgi:hypothetical protein
MLTSLPLALQLARLRAPQAPRLAQPRAHPSHAPSSFPSVYRVRIVCTNKCVMNL